MNGLRSWPGCESSERKPPLILDTLAQLRHYPLERGVSPAAPPEKGGLTVDPAGDVAAKLVKRARAKYISLPLAVSLADLSSPLEQSYRNTVYCAATLSQEAGALTGHYCGNRWCLVCNRVRTARAINRYLPAVAAWEDTQLVTLTVPNVGAPELAGRIDQMGRDLRLVVRNVQRTDRLPFRALRKLECTYNPRRDDFHPHLHLAAEGRLVAEALRRRWLQQNPGAVSAAQDVRPCGPDGLREMFKYFTKLITKQRPGAGAELAGSRAVAPVVALDVIFSAMKGRRVYQPMGFRAAPDPASDEEGEVGTAGATAAPKRPAEALDWEWLQMVHDWVDLSTGETLTGYEPTTGYRQLVADVERRCPGEVS